jgi:hypothetical protein
MKPTPSPLADLSDLSECQAKGQASTTASSVELTSADALHLRWPRPLLSPRADMTFIWRVGVRRYRTARGTLDKVLRETQCRAVPRYIPRRFSGSVLAKRLDNLAGDARIAPPSALAGQWASRVPATLTKCRRCRFSTVSGSYVLRSVGAAWMHRHTTGLAGWVGQYRVDARTSSVPSSAELRSRPFFRPRR